MADRPLRIAIIGAGPSGFYAADALQKQAGAEVDVFDRLPTPYGLVRGGVAPDHQSIKAVVRVYERTAAHPAFRFFGHVTFGRDLTLADLAERYDAWIYATGAESDRRLGIPGEDLAGSHSATEFVGWYNGHPDFCTGACDLSAERVVVVGVGNVAMDVTRILVQDPDRLAGSDIAGYALDALRHSRVREVVLLGRRGPAQAAFSPQEIAEIADLPGVDVVIAPEDVEVDAASAEDLEDATVRKTMDVLRDIASRPHEDGRKRVIVRFRSSPVELVGRDGRVTGVVVERNRLERDHRGQVVAIGTGETELVPAGLVFRSVGYKGVALPDVPFDARTGTIPNDAGRVRADGELAARQYVVGWAKRGPSGLIGTNKGDSQDTVKHLLEDVAPTRTLPDRDDVVRLLDARGVRWTSFTHWRDLDRQEVERGAAKGKIREKFAHVGEMLEAIKR